MKQAKKLILSFTGSKLVVNIHIHFSLSLDKAFVYLNKLFGFSDTNWLLTVNNKNLKSNVVFVHFVKIVEDIKL